MESRGEKTERMRDELHRLDSYNRPTFCKECGGVMIFKGVGEYQCEDCGYLDYDDYGKVRNYIEKHNGATAAMVAEATGVSQRAINEMLRESRLEIATTSKVFMKCELCGAGIRYGRLCPKCETDYHRSVEERARSKRNINISGYGTEKPSTEDGAKRFIRSR